MNDRAEPQSSGMWVVLKSGECAQSIAARHKHLWQTIWLHPCNKALRDRAVNESVLAPGDRVFVPTIESQSFSRASERRHLFRRQGIPSYVHVRLLDATGSPRAGESYTLSLAGGATMRGEVNGDGWISEPIDPSEPWAELTLADKTGKTDVFRLNFGALDPIYKVGGVQSRLRNLGFEIDPHETEVGPSTCAALATFQRGAGLRESGRPDRETLDLLVKFHGS